MAQPQDHISMALFCDFENVALGVRDANYDKFDIKRVLERLLLKGSIVVKKAYCDWDRYRQFKGTMHEANFELIEIPHVRQSGKNSADIRMVVDALDLCYTKSHVNTFVIISGDSDFSPLVSKLRENAKYVIGVGVKQSTSDLLIANCDEFIFYDDLVRESQRQRGRDSRDQQPQQRRSPEEEKRRREEMDARRTKVVEMAAETYEALVTDRDEGGRVWASVLKEALKRRNPGFSEQYYGFRTFGNLLEEAQSRGLLDLGRDEKSGLYVFRGSGVPTRLDMAPPPVMHDNGHRRHEARQAPVDIDATNAPVIVHAGEPVLDAVDVPVLAQAELSSPDDAAEGTPGGAASDRPRTRGGRSRGGRKTEGRKPAQAGQPNQGVRTAPDSQDATPAQPGQRPQRAPGGRNTADEAPPPVAVAPVTAAVAATPEAPAKRGRQERARNTRKSAEAASPPASSPAPAPETRPAAQAPSDPGEAGESVNEGKPAGKKTAARTGRPRKTAAKKAAEA